MNPDVISLNETHLFDKKGIDLEGYMWFGHNTVKHVKAPKGSRGLGFCIKNICWNYTVYRFDIIDKQFLKESKLYIVNGRICPLNDNYTSTVYL